MRIVGCRESNQCIRAAVDNILGIKYQAVGCTRSQVNGLAVYTLPELLISCCYKTLLNVGDVRIGGK